MKKLGQEYFDGIYNGVIDVRDNDNEYYDNNFGYEYGEDWNDIVENIYDNIEG